MILDSRRGYRGTLIDLDKLQVIKWARWANLSTGDFEAFSIDPDAAKKAGLNPKAFLYRGRARLKFIPGAPVKPVEEKPIAKEELRDGIEQYRESFVKVWASRGICPRTIGERWATWVARHQKRQEELRGRTLASPGDGQPTGRGVGSNVPASTAGAEDSR